MECFFVDGSCRSFADIILQRRVVGHKCLVASYGFGVLQVRKLLSAFDSVILVADVSHSQLNADAYETIVEMSVVLPSFSFLATKTHAKFALVDDETVIFTSANISANRRLESYMIGSFCEFSGLKNLKRIFTEAVSVDGNHQLSGNKDDYNVVEARYLDIGKINEPGYSHIVDD